MTGSGFNVFNLQQHSEHVFLEKHYSHFKMEVSEKILEVTFFKMQVVHLSLPLLAFSPRQGTFCPKTGRKGQQTGADRDGLPLC